MAYMLLTHAYNHGLKFKDFKVPKENLLVPAVWRRSNCCLPWFKFGRLALCSVASGS